MALVRPRLTDHYGIAIAQEAVDFAIPFLDEDIPLSLDPFLLWKSPSQQDNSLHTGLVNSFNHLGHLVRKGDKDVAAKLLIALSECEEVGLGFSATRAGRRIGEKTATDILRLFEVIPQVTTGGFSHFEEIQLLVDGISKDRVSDIACNYMMSFLIDFTIEQCQKLGIPMQDVVLPAVYNYRFHRLDENQKVKLPVSPATNHPIILLPKRWLRAIPWLNFEDYINNHYLKEVAKDGDPTQRVAVLNYNRDHYDVVRAYTMNVMTLGDEEAQTLGVDTRLTRGALIVGATLITAASVSIAGIVGWVGLVIPHIARLLVGPDFRKLLEASIMLGGAYMLVVDTLARSIAMIEIPLGILTAVVGAPFFLWLLASGRKGWS